MEDAKKTQYQYQYQVGQSNPEASEVARMYKPLGIRMTSDQVSQYEEAKKKQEDTVNSQRGQISSAYNALMDEKGNLIKPEDAWNKFAESFVPIHVYDSDKHVTIGDYYFPQSAMSKLWDDLHGSGVNVNPNSNTNGINIDTEGYGKELTEALEDAWWDMHDSFMSTAQQAYKEGMANISSGESSLRDAESALNEQVAWTSEAEANAKKQVDDTNRGRGETLSALFG